MDRQHGEILYRGTRHEINISADTPVSFKSNSYNYRIIYRQLFPLSEQNAPFYAGCEFSLDVSGSGVRGKLHAHKVPAVAMADRTFLRNRFSSVDISAFQTHPAGFHVRNEKPVLL